MVVRPETPHDVGGIRSVIVSAFADHPFSRHTEHLIVEELRRSGALALSLVAEKAGSVIGHIAFSSARVGDTSEGWLLLGPLAVEPSYQRRGVGSALVEAGLEWSRSAGASGVVLVGDPGFYRRFGFRSVPGVHCSGVPDENVLCLLFRGRVPAGELLHHPAFSVSP